MRATDPLRTWLISFAACIGAVILCVTVIDPPVARFVHDHLRQAEWFDGPTHLPEPFVPLALVVLLGAGLWVMAGRRLAGLFETAALAGVSLIFAVELKTRLKFVFGRLWPETWVNNNPSLIGDGSYRFEPFHGGTGWESFPSGHTAVTLAIVTVLWIRHPVLKPALILAVAAVATGLVGMNYHFPGDVVAGAFVGFTTGYVTINLWRAWRSDRRPETSAPDPV